MKGYVVAGVVLQVAMVVTGHFLEAVLMMSGILGVGIPFALGLAYGASRAPDAKEASRDGFLIGLVGAFVGVIVAILLGDQTWALLSFAPVSSGLTGLLGAVIGRLIPGSPAP